MSPLDVGGWVGPTCPWLIAEDNLTAALDGEKFGDDATILSIDVVGYSRLMTDDGPETVKALEGRRDLVTQLVTQEGGRSSALSATV
jgi:class 3 adenylate cyclase